MKTKTVSQHLAEFHKATAATHTALGKAHASLSEDHQTLAQGDDAADTHARIAKAHLEASKAHADAGQFNADCCKELDGDGMTHKAASGETIGTGELYELRVALEKVNETLSKQLVPTSVSAVLPDNPTFRRNVTPVPRLGQPDLERTAGLAPELQHFVKVED